MHALLALMLLAAPDAGPVDAGAREPSPAELLRASAEAVLAEPAPQGAPRARDAWDFHTAPAYFDLVTGRYPLDEKERALLFENGFVVASRFRQRSYHEALHELHTSQLPVFVSTDAVLHAVFRSHEAFLVELESTALAPRLAAAVKRLHLALPEARALWPKEVGDDVDFYLRMARHLGGDRTLKPSVPEAAWLKRIRRAAGADTVTLFGRPRRVDFSQFQPRGHYIDAAADLRTYFQQVMWLSRLELNLKSNACASSHPGPGVETAETPREVLVALALAELAQRSGTMADWQQLDRAFGLLAGRREDVGFAQLASLRAEAGVTALTEPDAAARVVAAIGERHRRSVNLHLMPERPIWPLPVIATVLGPRVTADTEALGQFWYRLDPIAWAFVLGHQRAFDYAATRGTPRVDRTLAEEAQRRLAATRLGDDLYATWLRALLAHGRGPSGVQSSFTAKSAWADFRVGTSIVGFAQLRHNNVLYAAQAEGAGCRIPDGYVEPDVETYLALADAAKASRALAAELLPPAEQAHVAGFFERMERTLRVLAAVSRQELANQPLSADAQRFLAMVAETWAVRLGYGRLFVAQRDGWYYDLLYPLESDVAPGNERAQFTMSGPQGAVFASTEFIADLHGDRGLVTYAGARTPELGFFVVDTGGPPRVMVGPVARGFVTTAPRNGRLTDGTVAVDVDHRRFVDAPWAASYRAPSGRRRLTGLPDGDSEANRHRWGFYERVPTGVVIDDGFGPAMETDAARLEKPITVRVLGEHGEELFKGETRASFVVPKEHRAGARLLQVVGEGEVVELSTEPTRFAF